MRACEGGATSKEEEDDFRFLYLLGKSREVKEQRATFILFLRHCARTAFVSLIERRIYKSGGKTQQPLFCSIYFCVMLYTANTHNSSQSPCFLFLFFLFSLIFCFYIVTPDNCLCVREASKILSNIAYYRIIFWWAIIGVGFVYTKKIKKKKQDKR